MQLGRHLYADGDTYTNLLIINAISKVCLKSGGRDAGLVPCLE